MVNGCSIIPGVKNKIYKKINHTIILNSIYSTEKTLLLHDLHRTMQIKKSLHILICFSRYAIRQFWKQIDKKMKSKKEMFALHVKYVWLDSVILHKIQIGFIFVFTLFFTIFLKEYVCKSVFFSFYSFISFLRKKVMELFL